MQGTSTRSVVGVFDDYATAQKVVERLTSSGFSRDEIEISSANTYAEDASWGNTGLSGRAPSDQSGGGVSGFFRRLFGSDVDEHESSAYANVVRGGGTIVCVTADERNEERAVDIMNEYGAVDIDQSGSTTTDRSMKSGSVTDRDRSIPVVQEEMRVGKRAVQRGGVRVYNRVTEQPVEESVNLREEHVRVDRRAVNRPATDADINQHDEVIEMTEMAEEPIVEKRTRVVEEVVIAKETNERTETIRDKVRRSDVDVERMGGTEYSGDYDDDFRRDFTTRYASNRSAKYETYAPAYQYGYRMASDERYRGRNWNDVESTLRTDYERSYPNSKWEQMKDSVRYGWEKVTGQR